MFDLEEIKSAVDLERGDYIKADERIVRVNTVFINDDLSVDVRTALGRFERFITPECKVNVYKKTRTP